MISEIKSLISRVTTLKETTKGQIPEYDLLLAISVLLLDMAGADNDFAPEEVQACFRNLEMYFNLSDTESLALLEEAETVRVDKEKVSHLIQTLNENFDEDQRIVVLALVWSVVVADKKIEKPELRFANQLRVRLQLSEDQAEEARKMAFSGNI